MRDIVIDMVRDIDLTRSRKPETRRTRSGTLKLSRRYLSPGALRDPRFETRDPRPGEPSLEP